MIKIRKSLLAILLIVVVIFSSSCMSKEPEISEGVLVSIDKIASERLTWALTTGTVVGQGSLADQKVNSIGFRLKKGNLYFVYGYKRPEKQTPLFDGINPSKISSSFVCVYGCYQFTKDGIMSDTTGDLDITDLMSSLRYAYNPQLPKDELIESLKKMYLETIGFK